MCSPIDMQSHASSSTIHKRDPDLLNHVTLTFDLIFLARLTATM